MTGKAILAPPATGAGNAARYHFSGAARLEYPDDESTNFKSDVLHGLTSPGVLDNDFSLTLDSQARPVALTQRYHSQRVAIDYSVSVTGYQAEPTLPPG